jgi:hypothetical protein
LARPFGFPLWPFANLAMPEDFLIFAVSMRALAR